MPLMETKQIKAKPPVSTNVSGKGPNILKFRVPEISLGALLAVAIFAMGMLFASSQKPSSADQQVTPAKTHDQGEQAKPPDGELTGSTWLTKDAAGFFTFILVCVGGIQAWFFWVQLRLIRQSLSDAKIAADAAERAARAAENSIELARQTAERQLRAYIVAGASCVNIHGPANEVSVSVDIVIKNTGQTPAHELNVVSKTALLKYPIKMPFNFNLHSGPDPSRAVLGAGEPTGTNSGADRPFNGDEMMCARDAESGFRIHTWGSVSYRDVFGHKHYTNFCSSIFFEEDGTAVGQASEHHNDAS